LEALRMQIWTPGGAAVISLDEGRLPLEDLDSIGLPKCPATFYRLRKPKFARLPRESLPRLGRRFLLM